MKHPFNTRNTITEPARRIQRYALVLPICRCPKADKDTQHLIVTNEVNVQRQYH